MVLTRVFCKPPRDDRRAPHIHSTRCTLRHADVSEFMSEWLGDARFGEMARFVNDELLTDTWMRALSLADPVAPLSDRTDHGPCRTPVNRTLVMGRTAQRPASSTCPN